MRALTPLEIYVLTVEDDPRAPPRHDRDSSVWHAAEGLVRRGLMTKTELTDRYTFKPTDLGRLALRVARPSS